MALPRLIGTLQYGGVHHSLGASASATTSSTSGGHRRRLEDQHQLEDDKNGGLSPSSPFFLREYELLDNVGAFFAKTEHDYVLIEVSPL